MKHETNLKTLRYAVNHTNHTQKTSFVIKANDKAVTFCTRRTMDFIKKELGCNPKILWVVCSLPQSKKTVKITQNKRNKQYLV